MDDVEAEDYLDEDYVEDVLYQACYVFRSTQRREDVPHSTHKKRKLGHLTESSIEWPILDAYGDSLELASKRRTLFETLQDQRLMGICHNDVDEGRTYELLTFIASSAMSPLEQNLKVALLLTGPDNANYSAVIRALQDDRIVPESCIFVNIESRQCPNFQTSLKNIIKTTIVNHSGAATYGDFLVRNKQLLPLNFDLELLEKFILEQSIKKIVISLPDIENLDGQTANDLIKTLHLWRTRLRCVLILGITSTRDLFEQRLSKATLKYLDTRAFDFSPQSDQFSNLVHGAQSSGISTDISTHLFLGPSLIRSLYDLSQAQGSNAKTISDVLSYAYISHFLANPTSVLCDSRYAPGDTRSVHGIISAARSTPSFRAFCEKLSAEKTKAASAKLRALLDHDDVALEEIQKCVSEGANAYASACRLISSISDLYGELSRFMPRIQKARFEIESLLYQSLDNLTNSPVFETIRDCVVSLDPLTLKDVLASCTSHTIASLGLQEIALALGGEVQNRSPSVLHTSSFQDTDLHAISSKMKRGKPSGLDVGLARTSMQIPTTEKLDQKMITMLEKNLQASSYHVGSHLLNEAYVLSSHAIKFKQHFDSQPRAAMERALVKPGDYLTCDCCGLLNHDAISDKPKSACVTFHNNTMPPASVLFILLQEAPTIVNVRDLYDAFSSRVGHTVDMDVVDDEDDPDRANMIIFYRAIAEFKMLGLLKASTGTQVKRKATTGRTSRAAAQEIEYVAKTSWVGL